MMLEAILNAHDESQFLIADGLDDAVIGLDEYSMRLIYSVKKAKEILMSQGMTGEEAIEHYHFNIEGAHVGKQTPIWCADDYI